MKTSHGDETGRSFKSMSPVWGNILSMEDIKDPNKSGKSKSGNSWSLTNNAKVYVDGNGGKDINTGGTTTPGKSKGGNSFTCGNTATRYANGVSGPAGSNRYGGGV